jgi:hypothetical protein
MAEKNFQDYHIQYVDVIRNWSPTSEKYGGGDTLVTAINNGWDVGDTVYLEEFMHYGQRRVAIYHFELKKGSERRHLAVVDNPYVTRFVTQTQRRVLPYSEAKTQPVE